MEEEKKSAPLEGAEMMSGNLVIRREDEDICGFTFQTADDLVGLLENYGLGRRVDVTIYAES